MVYRHVVSPFHSIPFHSSIPFHHSTIPFHFTSPHLMAILQRGVYGRRDDRADIRRSNVSTCVHLIEWDADMR